MVSRINYLKKKRVLTISLVLLVWVLVIMVTLFRVQVIEYNHHFAKIKAQSQRLVDLHPKRGTIYDRLGEILAISVKVHSAFISNRDIVSSLGVFDQVGRKIELSNRQKISIRKRIRRGEKFVWLKRKLSDAEYLTLRSCPFSGSQKGVLNYLDEYQRVYPQGNTAAHVLGGVGIDEQALNGVELSFDSTIKGRGGKVEVFLDARRKIFHLEYLQAAQSGRDLQLTIDAVLQFMVERELARAVRDCGAQGGAAVVMDSRDGTLLALASFPDYSPQEIWKTSPEILKNKAISFLYDPGSTFKIILAAAALENRICHPQQIFNCDNGIFQIRDRVIRDVHAYDRLSFTDIIVNSSNIGAAKIGLRLGAKRYFSTIRDFGFGDRTGIQLPGEEAGIMNPPARWSNVSLAYLSFGYEIAVTPIQMIRALNAIASNGVLMSPELVKNRPQSATLPQPARFLSSATLRQLREIMTAVVDRGTGRKAGIPGVSIAGKTGTTQKLRQGEYSQVHISSFGGFLPVEKPRVSIYVMLDEPTSLYYGGDVAAPLFKAIAEKIMMYSGLFPDVNVGGETRL